MTPCEASNDKAGKATSRLMVLNNHRGASLLALIRNRGMAGAQSCRASDTNLHTTSRRLLLSLPLEGGEFFARAACSQRDIHYNNRLGGTWFAGVRTLGRMASEDVTVKHSDWQAGAGN